MYTNVLVENKIQFLTKHYQLLILSLCVFFVIFVNIACTSAGLRGRTTKKARLSVSLCLRLPGDKTSKDNTGSCSLPARGGPFTQLIGSDWVWCLLVPEVSHWLPLIPGVGKGGEAHAAEQGGDGEEVSDDDLPAIGGREDGGEGFDLITARPTRFTWLTIRGALPLDAGQDKEEEAEGGHCVSQAD